MPRPPVLTIGHSTHTPEAFLALLRLHGVEAVADVRSSPFSRFNPQFNREVLEQFLKTNGIRYVFLGRELGARSEDRSCYDNGRVQYARLAQTPLFQSGLERVLQGAIRFRVAVMCAEKEPLECHRTLLVAKALVERGQPVVHIYEARFLDLMSKRKIEDRIPKEVVADGCLLCSEDKPHHCHRRLVAEYLKQHWGDLDISHLG